MKILHIIPNLPLLGAEKAIGGAASALWTLGRHQAEEHSVSVLANVIPLSGMTFSDSMGSVRLHTVDMKAGRRSVSFGIEFFLRALVHRGVDWKKVDVLHFHAGFADYLPVAIGLAAVRRLPLVFSGYCPAIHLRPPRFFFSLVGTALTPKVAVSGISDNVVDFLQSLGLPTDHVRKVQPAIDLEALEAGKVEQDRGRRMFDLPADRPIILFVGSFRPEKNLVTLVRAMAAVVDQRPDALLIATTELSNRRDEANRRQIVSTIADKGLEDNVRFMRYVERMPALMSAADLCVFPFLHTKGPSDYFIAALEAMALGKAVVVSPVGGMPEVVTKDTGVAVNPHSEEEISGAIINLLRAAGERNRIGATAREEVHRRFNVSRAAMETAALYEEVSR